MWIIMAALVSFAATTHGMLRSSEYLERKNPLNKLGFNGAFFRCDLLPVQSATPTMGGAPVTLSPHALNPGVPRQIDIGQVGIKLKNSASFPISCILFNADTEVAGIKPPRTVFPKNASTVQPGSSFNVPDERMNMNGLACGNLNGKIDMLIKYGLPGKEKFELHLVCDLAIKMENFGLVAGVHTALHGSQ